MSPRVEVSITRTFEAEHSLPAVGAPERHKHVYAVECGYARKIDPRLGCTMPLQDSAGEVSVVLSRLDGHYLNDVLPGPPTAEILACWILGELSPQWEWVSIRAYEGFMCRVSRADLMPEA